MQIHQACFDTGFGPATTTTPQPAPAPLDIVGLSSSGGEVQVDIDPGSTTYGSVWLERLMTPGAGWLTDTGSVFNPGINQLTTPLSGDLHTRYRAVGAAP